MIETRRTPTHFAADIGRDGAAKKVDEEADEAASEVMEVVDDVDGLNVEEGSSVC